jgi:FkbM family methyltransferase
MKRLLNFIKSRYIKVFIFFKKSINISSGGKLDFKIYLTTVNEYFRAKTFYTKEPEMLEWIDNFSQYTSKDNFILWDIGANIGIYSLYTAAKYPSSSVYSFEPEATSFNSLCKNIFMNSFSNIKPFLIGISNRNGYDLLKVSDLSSGAGAASIGKEYAHIDSKNIFSQGINIIKLDSLIKDHKFPCPNFIKIDVDGHEKEILDGAKNLLYNKDLHAIMIEIEYKNQKDLKTYIDLFKGYEFKLTRKSTWKDFSNELIIQNFLFEKTIK